MDEIQALQRLIKKLPIEKHQGIQCGLLGGRTAIPVNRKTGALPVIPIP